ncbi:MAG TPA: deoxyribonuclease IV [Verrucomicrobiae bacterium]|nr:deoxyribonuclease IV [Verrucomicrobiae bacterium]
MKFGAHMSTSGGIWKALQRGKSIGCECVQVFVKNNMQWAGRPHGADELALYSTELAAGCFNCVFGHTGYLINLGAAPSENRDRSLKSLMQEIELASALKLPFLVMHPGSHLGAGEESGLRQIIAGLDEVFAVTRKLPVRIALENTAGQGSCLGNDIAHLGRIFDGVKKPERLGVCLDTAHFFAAGYDIRTQKGWDKAIAQVRSTVGLENILAFHLNDSKTALNSRVDRHAHIGQGQIGKEAFRHIVRDPRFASHPACLETPKSQDLHEDIGNLEILRKLAGVETL